MEILVAAALLSFIILGLLMTFGQVQRAFRGGMAQTDILETGRGAMDIMVRELDEMTPSSGADFMSGGSPYHTMNFFAELDPFFSSPLVQDLPGTVTPPVKRINIVQRFFFLTRVNQDWIGTGYVVVPDSPNGVVGPLYRYCVTNTPRFGPITAGQVFLNLLSQPLATIQANCYRVADGVVHLRVRAYDTKGVPLIPGPVPGGYLVSSVPPYPSVKNTTGAWRNANGFLLDTVDCQFWSNAVPGSLELELGVLEPNVLKRYKAIAASGVQAQTQYLNNHVAQVHLFRQRIPIRNVDVAAYQ